MHIHSEAGGGNKHWTHTQSQGTGCKSKAFSWKHTRENQKPEGQGGWLWSNREFITRVLGIPTICVYSESDFLLLCLWDIIHPHLWKHLLQKKELDIQHYFFTSQWIYLDAIYHTELLDECLRKHCENICFGAFNLWMHIANIVCHMQAGFRLPGWLKEIFQMWTFHFTLFSPFPKVSPLFSFPLCFHLYYVHVISTKSNVKWL